MLQHNISEFLKLEGELDMYEKRYNKDGTLGHSDKCTMIMGIKDKNCPRCVELLSGSPVRSSRHEIYFDKKSAHEVMDFYKDDAIDMMQTQDVRHVWYKVIKCDMLVLKELLKENDMSLEDLIVGLRKKMRDIKKYHHNVKNLGEENG